MSTIGILDFYFPSPTMGRTFSAQLPEFRTNSTSLAALVKSAYQDQDPSPSLQHALAGLAFGEQTFNKRYRVFYDSTANALKIQYNTNTAINPTWTDYLSIRDLDGRVTILGAGGLASVGGFYGLTVASNVTFKESETGGFSKKSDTLVVDSNVFYLTSGGSGKPLLSLRDISGVGEINTASNLGGGTGLFAQKVGVDLQFKSLLAGTNISLSNNASTVTINSTASGGTSDPGFYGIIFKESKAGGRKEKDDTLVVDSSSGFYLTQAGTSGKPLLSFRDYVGSLSSTSTGDQSLVSADTAVGSSHSLILKKLTAGTNITFSADANQITINSSASGGASDPGFYGITFKESKSGGRVERDDTLIFDTNSGFYLSQAGDDRKPLLAFHDHVESILSTSTGDQSLLSTETVVGAGHRATLKKLTAGTNITLGSDANQITINSSGSGSTSPGFYGIVFRESKSGGRVERDDTLVFSSLSGFYLTQAGDDGKPLLSLADVVASVRSTTTGDQTLVSSDTSVGSLHTITTKRLTAGTNITFSADANQVTINSSAGGSSSSPGFYGIVFRESKAGSRIERDDTLVFDSNFFYLSQAGDDGKPFLSYVGFPTFAESEAGGFRKSINSLIFDSNFFYITTGGNDRSPIVSFAPNIGQVRLASYTISSSTPTLDLIGVISSAYEFYEVVLRLAPVSDDVELWVQTSTNGGQTFDAGSTSYEFSNNSFGGGGYGTLSSTGSTAMKIGHNLANRSVGNAAGKHIFGSIKFHRGSASLFPTFHWDVTWHETAGVEGDEDEGGGSRQSAATINAIRLLFETGNIASGLVTIYGLS